jgi:Carboxypeptidase regulatory-like domain
VRLTVAAGCLLYALSAYAQSGSGTITGTISDAAGAVIPNAPVEVKNIQTSAVYTGASSGTGNYTIAELPTGTYTLTATAPGFKKDVHENIPIPVSQTVRVDVLLQVGAASDSITISSEAPVLKTESGETSHNFTGQSLEELPVLQVGASATGLRNPYAS